MALPQLVASELWGTEPCVGPLSLEPSKEAGPGEARGSPLCLSHLVTEHSKQEYSKSEQLAGTRGGLSSCVLEA